MTTSIMSLDVGEKRVGVALANNELPFPSPLLTLTNDESIWSRLRELVKENGVIKVVVGLPRNMSGEETAQAKQVRNFTDKLQKELKIEIAFQDETLTSVRAEKELKAKSKEFKKEQVDALAATYILEDYLGVISSEGALEL